MVDWAVGLFGAGMGLIVYTYVLYPGLLKLLGAGRTRPQPPRDPDVWPAVSVSLPVHNEEHRIAETLESLLSLDYPRDRLQILVVSDASSDRTDDIVRAYADRGVEILRIPERKGKGAAETAATAHLTGEIVVATDASIRIAPDALKPLVRVFSDPQVGLASGRQVRVASDTGDSDRDDGGPMGYGMAIRALESRAGSTVGASGRCYAIRLHLHRVPLPVSLSRDFAAPLHCRERDYRAVFVPEAVCYVPRASSPGQEYQRRVGAITRKMATLLHKRRLLNPFRYGVFAWMLFSHVVCRWLVPWAGTAALAGLALMAPSVSWARPTLVVAVGGLLVGSVGWLAADRRDLPRVLAVPAFALMGGVAGMHALLRVIKGGDAPRGPTRRATTPGGE